MPDTGEGIPVSGSKTVWEEVAVIDPRDSPGPGIREGWASSLMEPLGLAPEENQLNVFGPTESALQIRRILQRRQGARPLGT